MNNLQRMITEKLESGKSYRRIGEECKIDHVSVSRYHQGLSTPNGKNLAILEKYFNTKMENLVESGPVTASSSRLDDDYIGKDRRHALELRLIIAELEGLSPTAQLEWLLRIRKEKEAEPQE